MLIAAGMVDVTSELSSICLIILYYRRNFLYFLFLDLVFSCVGGGWMGVVVKWGAMGAWVGVVYELWL